MLILAAPIVSTWHARQNTKSLGFDTPRFTHSRFVGIFSVVCEFHISRKAEQNPPTLEKYRSIFTRQNLYVGLATCNLSCIVA